MGSFGNEMGAAFGGEIYSSKANNWSNDEWEALMGRDKPANYWDQIDQDNVAKLDYDKIKSDPDVSLTPDSNLLGVVPGLLTDDTTYNAVGDELNGGNALNWESWTFGDLRAERNALKPGQIGQLATNWQGHGDELKGKSEQFKKDVTNAITGHWTGASAEAAEAASAQVTKTSIYDVTPSSDALYNRLTVLETAFNYIQDNFPHGDEKVIDKFEEYDKQKLDQKVAEYNSKYHFDGGGHLRLSNGQYVDVSTAIDDAERIRNSIRDYRTAVALFDKTYNPTVEAVTDNFPTLPPPPNMTFGKPPGDPGGPGTGPGTGPSGLPNLGGGPDLKNMAGLKPSDLPKIPDPKLPDPKLPDPNLPDTQTTDPSTSTGQDGLSGLTSPISSAMDAAKDAIGQAVDAAKNAGQGPQDPNLGGPQGPPEGVLGLGPQGLGGAGAGKGAGGVGGGAAMPRGLANATPMSAPATAAAKAPAAAAGAGLASGAGSPGAGAPAAGQRGGDQNGKGHQVNKALRRKKNGKEVIGDAEAAVPVVGAPENQGEAEVLQIDASDKAQQPDGVTTTAGTAPRRVPRPRQPMQIPGH